MTARRLYLGGLELTVPDSWQDVTEQLEADSPFTLADPEQGVGALQLSPALYQGGSVPHLSTQELLSLAHELGQQRALGAAADEEVFSQNALQGVGLSFHSGEDFIQIWYVSDGRNVALLTYVCEWSVREHERSVREHIVRSVRFVPRSP